MKIASGLKVHSLVLAAALGASLSYISPTFAQNHPYIIDLNSKEIIDLGVNGYPTAINDSGQVAGWSGEFPAGAHQGFITGPNGAGIKYLDTLGGITLPTDINDIGQVVGESDITTRDSIYHAFITGANGTGITNLGTLGGVDSAAFGVNNTGMVVGWSHIPYVPYYWESSTHAFMTGANGVEMTDFGYMSAEAINDAGQVVGSFATKSGIRHVYITGSNGVGMTDIGALGGNATARDINNIGQVVGDSDTPTGATHAFITGPNGAGMTDLGTLGGSGSFAFGINAAGQVVGYSETTTGAQHAFITGPYGSGMTDLNSLVKLPEGITLTSAIGINNHGQVIAEGVQGNGIPPPPLGGPPPLSIPEPQSYILMLAGLALVGFMVRHQTQADKQQRDLAQLSSLTRNRLPPILSFLPFFEQKG